MFSGGNSLIRSDGVLATRFDPRSNSLAMLRLGLAATVAVVHTTELGFGWQPEFAAGSDNPTAVGDIAVDGFFVLSGFLVTRSFLRLRSLRDYVWHRFLRIMPGFWVCLLVTAFVLAPVLALLDGRSPVSVLTGPESSPHYVLNNAALLMRQFGIDGLPVEGYAPGVLDGSLWTLFYEALCYGLIGGLGLLGLLRRVPVTLPLAAGLSWVLLVASQAGAPVGGTYLLPLLTVFLLGATGHVYAHRLPINDLVAAVACAVYLVGLPAGPVPHALTVPAFAYLCLWAMVRLPLRANPGWDASYGVYIYHWPVLQLLVALGAASLGAVGLVLACLTCVGLTAAVSWRFVEAPALRLKDAQSRAAWVTSWSRWWRARSGSELSRTTPSR